MKAAVILVSLLAFSQPALAQSLFGGDDDPSERGFSSSPEGRQWIYDVRRLIIDRLPRLNLGHGRVTISFHVDRFGRVSDLRLLKYDNDALALATASTMSSLKLPPPPASAKAGCCRLSQSIVF